MKATSRWVANSITFTVRQLRMKITPEDDRGTWNRRLKLMLWKLWTDAVLLLYNV